MYAPNPEVNLTLGRGIPYFARKNLTTGLYEGFRDLGEASDIAANISADKLPFYSSRGGVKGASHEVTKQQALKFTLTLNEPNDDNLELAFMADREEVTQAAVADQSLVITSVTKGRYYMTGKKKITNVDVSLTSTPATIYTEGTDYVVDATYGRIFIPYTSTIAASSGITVAYDVEAGTYTRLKSLNQPRVEGQFHYISNNASGENHDMLIWRASIVPTGDMGFISDDWLSLKYEITVLKDEVGHPDAPYMIIESMVV